MKLLVTLTDVGKYVSDSLLGQTPDMGTRLFSLADSVWPFRSGRFGLSLFGLSHFGLSRFGLADSVWPFRSRDISVARFLELMKFVNVTEYLGRIIIYPYHTRQIQTRQFVLPKARSNSGDK